MKKKNGKELADLNVKDKKAIAAELEHVAAELERNRMAALFGREKPQPALQVAPKR